MQLTLTLSEGVLPPGTEQQALARLCDAMPKWHGLADYTVMTPNATGAVHVIPKGPAFSGSKAASGDWIEWKVPSFAFNTREVQQGYFSEATDIIHPLLHRLARIKRKQHNR